MAYRKKAEFILTEQPDILISLNVKIKNAFYLDITLGNQQEFFGTATILIKELAFFHISTSKSNCLTYTIQILNMFCPYQFTTKKSI